MTSKRILLLIVVLARLGFAESPKLELAADQLADPLKLLKDQDRSIVEQAIQLIRSGNHSLALVRLTSLNANNPQNSSLHILAAYAQLHLGNLLGAFDESKKAERAPNGNSYKCYFLAKIALLNGNKKVFQRELKHVKGAGDRQAEARELDKELKQAGSGS